MNYQEKLEIDYITITIVLMFWITLILEIWLTS